MWTRCPQFVLNFGRKLFFYFCYHFVFYGWGSGIVGLEWSKTEKCFSQSRVQFGRHSSEQFGRHSWVQFGHTLGAVWKYLILIPHLDLTLKRVFTLTSRCLCPHLNLSLTSCTNIHRELAPVLSWPCPLHHVVMTLTLTWPCLLNRLVFTSPWSYLALSLTYLHHELTLPFPLSCPYLHHEFTLHSRCVSHKHVCECVYIPVPVFVCILLTLTSRCVSHNCVYVYVYSYISMCVCVWLCVVLYFDITHDLLNLESQSLWTNINIPLDCPVLNVEIWSPLG